MRQLQTLVRVLAMALLPTAAFGQQLPLKYKAKPTKAPITAGDLMSRLYIFADDSMMGRQFGTEGNLKATAYIANEVKKLGLKPGGDDGYFQWVPTYKVSFDPRSELTVNGMRLVRGKDYRVSSPRVGMARSFDSLQVVYGGDLSDSTTLIDPASVAGKAIFLSSRGSVISRRLLARYSGAGAIVQAGNVRAARPISYTIADTTPAAVTITVTSELAAQLFGMSPNQAKVGTTGGFLQFSSFGFVREPVRARNVIAILPGSDPTLRSEYVAIGAHSDHLGFGTPADHDSLYAWNVIANRIVEARTHRTPGSAGGGLTSEERASIHLNVDSLHRVRPARLDSIYNGADDDGSGSVAVLEIAERMAKGKERPKRSILFVWHTGEEAGLLGSQWFTDHPTVPRDPIVAQLNMDMVGRGGASDYVQDDVKGGPLFVQLVGSRRLSTELGDLVEAVNRTEKIPLQIDYTFDANGHPERIYCRSDHYNYARYGIPITFFTDGLHRDYHQLTDESQYIDYPHLQRITQLVHDAAMALASLDHRPLVDKPKPNPRAACVQ